MTITFVDKLFSVVTCVTLAFSSYVLACWKSSGRNGRKRKGQSDMFHRGKAINREYQSSVSWASCPVKSKFSVFLEKKKSVGIF